MTINFFLQLCKWNQNQANQLITRYFQTARVLSIVGPFLRCSKVYILNDCLLLYLLATALLFKKHWNSNNMAYSLDYIHYNRSSMLNRSGDFFYAIPGKTTHFYLDQHQLGHLKDLNTNFLINFDSNTPKLSIKGNFFKRSGIAILSALRINKLMGRHTERKQINSKSVLKQFYTFFASLCIADSISSTSKLHKKIISKRKLFSSRYKILRKKLYNSQYTHIYIYSRVRELNSLFTAAYLASSPRSFKKNKILLLSALSFQRYFNSLDSIPVAGVFVLEHILKNNVDAISHSTLVKYDSLTLSYMESLQFKRSAKHYAISETTVFLKYLYLNPTVIFKGRFFSNLYFSATILSLYFQLLLNNLTCIAYKYYRFSFTSNKEPYSFRFINRKKFFYLDRIDFYDLYRIILIVFKSTDIDLLRVWIKKAFERVSFKKHKLLCYMLRFYLKRLFLVYRRYTPCLGFYLRVKGKIAVGGNARKRSFIVKQGSRSLTSKNLKINYVDFSLLTGTGVLGVKLLFSFR